LLSVSIYGAGGLGRRVAEILSRRPGYDVAGPWRRDDRDRALRARADVVVIATTSFLRAVAPDIRDAVEAGSSVITSAEEAAYPWAVDEALASELDALARARGVTILGGGLNPGFAFDALVATILGAGRDVDTIRVERVVDLSGFSEAIHRRIGVGFTPEEFEAGTREGRITGHIGFPQSMRIVARALGLELERIDRRIWPLFDESTGRTAGFEQHYVGAVAGRPWFQALFTGHVAPESIGRPPRDEIWIEGSPPLHVAVTPGLDAQTGSSALVANSVRRVAAAPPGWLTVADLPPAVPR
jgi:4-hydroxy-tetrahydrodipicolinate reductase